MRTTTSFLIGSLLLVATASPASAADLETPQPRQGYYVAFGFHGGANHNREEGDSLGTWGGSLFTLRLGQLVTRCFGLGLDIHSGGASGDDQTATLGGLAIAAQLGLATNLWLHGSMGIGVVSVDEEGDDDELRGTVGAGYSLALTYDWFPFAPDTQSGGWAVTPGVQLRMIPDDDFSSFSAFLGVELTWWSGLPRNQLDLPDSEAYR